MTVEEMVRTILDKAVKDGLVYYTRHHEGWTAGDLVGPANLLAGYLHEAKEKKSDRRTDDRTTCDAGHR